jgi:hypothetical protein
LIKYLVLFLLLASNANAGTCNRCSYTETDPIFFSSPAYHVDATSFDTWDAGGASTITFERSIKVTSSGVTSLDGDVMTPSNSFYYGTNISGVKGWYALATAGGGGGGDVTGPVNNTDDYVPQWNGADSKSLKNGQVIDASGDCGASSICGGGHTHSSYLSAETDPTFTSSSAFVINTSSFTAWNTAETDPVFLASSAYSIDVTSLNTISDAVTTESDPIFISSDAYVIDTTSFDTWNAGGVESDPIFIASKSYSVDQTSLDRITSALMANQSITIGGIAQGTGTTAITLTAGTGSYMPTTGDKSSWDSKLSANQTITISGIVSGSGTNAITISAGTGSYMPTTTDKSTWDAKQATVTASAPMFISANNVTVDLTSYAPKASPTFTGTVKLPTLNCNTIDTTADGTVQCGSDEGGVGGSGSGTVSPGTANGFAWYSSTSSIIFSTYPTVVFTNSTGSVGFGTSAPTTRLTVSGTLTGTGLIITGQASPTILSGPGAGASPTISITGSDAAGLISLTTGTSPTVSAIIGTVSFGGPAFPTNSNVVFSPNNSWASALYAGRVPYIESGTGTFAFTAGPIALTATTTYKWKYLCIGN